MRHPPLHRFVAAVLATVKRRRLFGPTDRVLVALSGGPDSTALLAALAALRARGALADLRAVHVDHRLRPDSALDAEFCSELCAKLGIPLDRHVVRVGPGNVQAQARRVRYAALRAAAIRSGATRIATGHTRTDQAETVLLRLLRGSGARGLAGIPPRRGALVRPLIDRSRSEVVEFLRDAALSWREDPTNASPKYLRNRVRQELVPALASVNPSVEATLARAADLLRDDDRALDRRARDAMGTSAAARADIARVRRQPRAVRRRIVRRLWRTATGSRARLSAAHVEAVLRLLARRAPGRAALPGGLEARCAYGTLSIGAPAEPPGAVTEVAIPAPGIYGVPGRPFRIEIEAAEVTPGPWPLVLRARRPGDRFRPERGRGAKKLKSWLIDRKVPRERRDALLVLADTRGEVLWIPELDARSAGLGAGKGMSVRLLPGGGNGGLQ